MKDRLLENSFIEILKAIISAHLKKKISVDYAAKDNFLLKASDAIMLTKPF